jgi:hypothetical protein
LSAEVEVLDSEPPNTDDVIAKLEEALAAAREGRISAVAIALVYRDGTPGRSWSKLHSRTTMLGSVSLLHHILASGYFED